MQTHQPKEDPIAKSLDLEPIVDEPKPVTAVVVKPEDSKEGQSERDLDYSRENLYHLIERGRDALDGILLTGFQYNSETHELTVELD